MAVQPQTPYKEYDANGVTTSFALEFDCEKKDHLIVTIDGVEPPSEAWSLDPVAKNVIFTTAPDAGKKITLKRNTPYVRTTSYQSYDNSFRPGPVNKDLDRLWLKLQELGVADWILSARIDALKNYVDRKDDELKAYLMEEIRKQGVALDQLDEYYNYLMQRLAQIAVDKGWDASFVVDGDKTQKQINTKQSKINNAIGFLAEIKESNTWQQNRDVIQALNDQIYAEYGGGSIQLPAGDFLVKGVLLDSNVVVKLNEATTLIHPDNYDGHIFETRRYMTNGSTVKNQFNITVDSTDNLMVGSFVGIRGAGGMSNVQSTLLVNAISSTDTLNLKLVNTTGFSNANTLIIGDEIISYTSLSPDGTLGGVARGLLGTTAKSYAANTPIGIALRHVSEIISISGNVITLLDAAKVSVSGASVLCGGQNAKVLGGKFKGEVQKDVAGWRWSPVATKLHRFAELNYYAENCEAVFYAEVTSDSKFDVRGKDIGKAMPEGVNIGAAGWLFQQCHRNEVNAKFVGDVWAGIYLDNRTVSGTEWDGDCNDNWGMVTCNYSNYSPSLTTTALLIVAGNNNQINVTGKNVHTVASIKATDQAYTHDGSTPTAQGNVITVSASNAYRSVICNNGATGNTLTISQSNVVESPIIIEGNVVLAMNAGGGTGTYARFRNGNYLRPAISFIDDPSLGFTREPDGSIRLYKSGEEICRFNEFGLTLPNGKSIIPAGGSGLKIGTSSSQKIGFFGVTPVVQPSIGNAATDAASTQTLVNVIRTALIQLGVAKI